jgi:hypothetical protein
VGDVLPLVGSLRGFRWWRYAGEGQLVSPWRGPVRWDPGENEASCLARRGMFGWKMARAPHPRGCPATGCECGFYALHGIPQPPDGSDPSIWEIDAQTSGGKHGLILGVAEGYGRVLVGTTGWRARFSKVLALYAGAAISARFPEIRSTAARYGVPIYRDLTAFAAEWGPDPEVVQELTA